MASEEQATHATDVPAAAGTATSAATPMDADPELTANLRDYLQDHRSYLQDQRGLAEVQRQYLGRQMKHLHEQRELTLSTCATSISAIG